MGRTIDLREAPGWFDNLAVELQKAALEGLYLAGLKGARYIVTNIIPSRTPQPVDRGTYRAGWGPASVSRVGNSVVMQNREVVAAFIEYGVRGQNVKIGRKLISALREWVLRKGIAQDEKEATGIAWAIARKAQERGFFNRDGKQGLQILGELIDGGHIQRFMGEEVSAAIKRSVG